MVGLSISRDDAEYALDILLLRYKTDKDDRLLSAIFAIARGCCMIKSSDSDLFYAWLDRQMNRDNLV